MPSRYERVASQVDAYMQQYGDEVGNADLIAILRICHFADEYGATAEALLDEIVEYLSEVFTPTTVTFSEPPASEPPASESPEPETTDDKLI